jgi:hypothetical protein
MWPERGALSIAGSGPFSGQVVIRLTSTKSARRSRRISIISVGAVAGPSGRLARGRAIGASQCRFRTHPPAPSIQPSAQRRRNRASQRRDFTL